MIQSRKVNAIVAICLCLALGLTILLIGLGNSETAKQARQSAYVSGLFGEAVIALNIQVVQEDWDNMLANAADKTYIMADVEVNGISYQNVGVRTKGNASLSQVAQTQSPQRYSLHIKFDEYISGQTCEGLDELILNNMIGDASYMKEYLSQDLMRYIGVEAPLTNYADISVNGQAFGFYVALESYGDSYSARVYEDDLSNYYNVKSMGIGAGGNLPAGEKPAQMPDWGEAALDASAPAAPEETTNAQTDDAAAAIKQAPEAQQGAGQGGMMPGGASGGSLAYSDDVLESYSAIFDNACGSVATQDQHKVIEALKALSTGTDLEQHFDVDQILRYFAAHTVVVNLDSYYSNMAQNYVLQERDGQITMLPWDYHLSYGGFQAGTADEVVNAAIETPVSGVTMESRPLLNVLLSDEGYLERYHRYLQEIVDGYFGSGLFEQTVRSLQEKIAPYVEADASAFFRYEQFQTGVETMISLNLLRAQSIRGQLDGSIPATTDGQRAEGAARIDASSIDLADLGSSGGFGGGFAGGAQRELAGGAQGGFVKGESPPDRAPMPEIVASAANTQTGQGSEITILGVLLLCLLAVLLCVWKRKRKY